MSNNYAIVRQLKRYSPDEVNGIWAENKRSIMGNNVDKNRSHLNIKIVPLPFKNYDHFIKTRSKQIDAANKKRDANERQARMRYIRKDKIGKRKYLSLMQELVFTHSNGAMSLEESIRYCTLAYEFIVSWFAECNVFLAVIHLDEETPHIHIWVDYFNKFDNRFEESVLQAKGKTNINKIRDAWQKKIEEEGFSLIKQDGSVVGGKHDGPKADKSKGDLKKLNEELTHEVETLKNENDDLKKENSVLIATHKEKDRKIIDLQQKFEAISNGIESLKKILQPWRKFIKEIFKLDIFKEYPPSGESNPSIESTLTNDTVSKPSAGKTTIPSLLN